MPITLITKSAHFVISFLVCLLCLAAALWLGDYAPIRIIQNGGRIAIAAIEFVCILSALVLVTLAAPRLQDIDLFRPRAKLFALVRFLYSFILLTITAGLTAYIVTESYLREEFPEEAARQAATTVPESEVLIHNSLFIFAVAGILIPIIGQSLGVLASLIVWVVGYFPGLLNPRVELWPLAKMDEVGPWFSIPHILTTASLLFVACVVQYRTAGMGYAARRNKANRE